MSRREVVMEITIETNQVLVIQRRQVTRSRCSECASEAELMRFDKVNVLVYETGNQQGLRFTDAGDGSDTLYLRSLRGAMTLAKRFLNCLRRGTKRQTRPESEKPEIQKR